MKKLIKLKLNILLKYWNYLNFLRTNGILIFCQNLSLNAKKELNMLNYLKNFDYKWKILDKKDLKKFLSKNFFIKIKKFNNILIIKDIYNIKEIEKYLKNNNILVLGYYIQNIFFFKKDFNIKNLDKKNIVNKLKQQILNIYSYKIKIINKIKFIWIKLILLLKKKNGNY